MIDINDWRLRGQDEYMQNEVFEYVRFTLERDGGHAHCEFCWHKFMEDSNAISDCSDSGYRSVSGKHWVCGACFADFRDMLHWTVAK